MEKNNGRNVFKQIILAAGGRMTTGTRPGAAVNVETTNGFGEGIELRWNVKYTASQFQGLFIRVAASSGVANTSTLRGAEFDARNASDQNVGVIEGVYGSASVKGTGTVDYAFGLDGNLGMDSDEAATITLGAAVRGKVQAEDAATLTEVYCILAEHEAITGNKAIRAAFGAKSGAGAAFTYGIDLSGGILVATSNEVTLIRFKGANGTVYKLVHDTGSPTVVAVGT